MITEIVAAAASAAKNTAHAILRFLDILIFVKFYMCEKYEIRL